MPCLTFRLQAIIYRIMCHFESYTVNFCANTISRNFYHLKSAHFQLFFIYIKWVKNYNFVKLLMLELLGLCFISQQHCNIKYDWWRRSFGAPPCASFQTQASRTHDVRIFPWFIITYNIHLCVGVLYTDADWLL